ncbi:MAG: FHA domain-containing protein [Deltaproteobacteria bacterium]|nr:FHA domain-containing protein [Deltaproteobacteria bacterium]
MDVGLVCDACSSFTPMGANQCSSCGAPLSLDSRSRVPEAVVATGDRDCPGCGSKVPAGNRFCGSCGYNTAADESAPAEAPLTRPAASAEAGTAADMGSFEQAAAPAPGKKKKKANTMFFSAIQASRAKLVLIKGDGLDGVSYTLAGEEHVAGRIEGPLLFEEDPFLSPVHANFLYRKGKLNVRDEGSANGVFIRIRGSHPINVGDRFLVGEQVLEVQESLGIDDPFEPEEDGTYFFASKRRESHFRLVQILRGGDTGLCYQAISDMVSIGRESNDINFPDDPFISGHHAQVSYAEGRLNLTDLGSKNGTFLRVNEESRLEHGDYVFMGQQLLRVEIV